MFVPAILQVGDAPPIFPGDYNDDGFVCIHAAFYSSFDPSTSHCLDASINLDASLTASSVTVCISPPSPWLLHRVLWR